MYTLLLGGMLAMQAQEKKKLTLDDIYGSTKFKGKTVSNIQWLPDGSAFTFTRTSAEGLSDIYRHNVETGEETLVLEAAMLAHDGVKIDMSAYQTTGMQNTLLITGPQRQIWRHSYAAPYFLYDIEDKSVIALAKGDPNLQNVELSPDGASVAFVRDNNLYVADVETGTSRAMTTDGSDNILNGVFDWVYEEEFGRPDAYRWSPDGKSIALWRTDQTRVKTFTIIDDIPYYSATTALKYPKVGEQNAVVQILVADVATGNLKQMDIGDDDDIYIPRINWTNAPNTLAMQRLNRKQNKLELLMAYTPSGKSSVAMTDENEAWIDVTNDFIFLKGSNSFLFTSEKSGYRHIYMADYNGKEQQLTSGDWEVGSIIGIDEANSWVYFYGKKTSPIHQHIYRVKTDGGNLQQISETLSWHVGNFSPDFQHYVSFSSNVRIPTTVTLRKTDGKLVRILEENTIEALSEYNMVYPEFMILNTNDDVKLNAYMMKPVDFDPSKKYPVLVFGYGGPGSQMVLDRWGGGSAFRHFQRTLWHQMMTEKGYIVFCIDNRGTGGQGKAFKNLAYGDLSKWSVADQILGARYLQSLPYVDKSRIGFWGWSGGGYLAMLIMTRASDFFKAGVAVASVSDFRNYDTIWTERYMGLLTENKAGYDAADANRTADQLKGDILIVHGSGDDNVHPGNSYQFINKLIDANKPFDMMIYPNRNHRISGGTTSLHLFTKITEFFTENL
ncbi:MAG: S9 family peptidase [Calditrichota bacterium]